MIEQALRGSKRYWLWISTLLGIIGFGVFFYLDQLERGLGVTGMSRDISWGFYIANFTFFVGVAASAVMLVMPYYLHDYKKFGPIIILGEWLAVASVSMCMMFIIADMGQPQRFMNVILHPMPGSMLIWDATVLNGYLALNLVIGWTTLHAQRKGTPPPKWVKFLIYLSIPWAVSIHTVTAFLYAGIPGRHLWLTAVMAPRFLASAFAAGPSLLIILIMISRRLTGFKVDDGAIQTLAKIVLYAMIANLFLYGMELFTALYSNIPSHSHTLHYLFLGLQGKAKLMPFMWAAAFLGISGVLILLVPRFRAKTGFLVLAASMIFASTYIDKGMGLVIAGFIPNPLEKVVEYTISNQELIISAGIWSIGLLIITILYKMAISIKQERE